MIVFSKQYREGNDLQISCYHITSHPYSVLTKQTAAVTPQINTEL